MKSRYGLWILSVCCIGLAGCSNWQNRVNNGGPGTAASLSAAPAGSASPMLSAPGTSFNEPPPPVPPPPSTGLGLTPTAPAVPNTQRLDLSAAEPPPPAPTQMYNLESSSKPATSRKSASTSKPSGKSSTISKLASKANTPTPEPESKPTGSAIARLSAKSQTSSATQDEPLPKPAAATENAATPSQNEPAATVDTTFLAQPVRKGASEDSNSSKGPQSNLIPSDNKLLYGKSKPAIYPVSNPAVEEPIDITRFS